MRTIFRLIVCLLLVIGWGLAGLSLHVVRTPDDIPITLVPKDRFGIRDTYVDTRGWTLDQVAEHQALVRKLIESGKADVLKHVVADAKAEEIPARLTEALHRSPATQDTGESTRPTTVEQTARSLWSIFQ